MFQFSAMEKANFRCVTCSKQTKVRKADGAMLRLYGIFEHPTLASERCQELKARPLEEFRKADSLQR